MKMFIPEIEIVAAEQKKMVPLPTLDDYPALKVIPNDLNDYEFVQLNTEFRSYTGGRIAAMG